MWLWCGYLFIKLLNVKFKCRISRQRFSPEQFYNYCLTKMCEIIIFKRNVLDWGSIKKIDTFEILNSWSSLYRFLYIQLAVLYTLKTLSPVFSCINNINIIWASWVWWAQCDGSKISLFHLSCSLADTSTFYSVELNQFCPFILKKIMFSVILPKLPMLFFIQN